MSQPFALPTAQSAAARLLSRAVLVLLFAAWVLGLSRTAEAGCDFGHGRQNDKSLADSSTYARTFRVLGKWVYEGGQAKYVNWQPGDHECDGPNCSKRKDRESPLGGISQTRDNRTNSRPVHFQNTDWTITPPVLYVTAVEKVETLRGYPTAYEYPP